MAAGLDDHAISTFFSFTSDQELNQLLNFIIFVLTGGQNRFDWGTKALIQKESFCKLVIQLVKIPHGQVMTSIERKQLIDWLIIYK